MTPAAEAGATSPGSRGIARLTAPAQVTDTSLWARGPCLVTGNGTFHPGLARPPGHGTGRALLSWSTGGLLAIRPVHDRAGGGLPKPDALLAFGAAPALARRLTREAGVGIRAGETLGTARGVVQPAWPPTPPRAADEAWLTCLLLILRRASTAFTLAPDARGQAVPDLGACSQRAQRLAGETGWALGIRDALAVGAIARKDALVEQAPERRLAVLAPLTAPLVRHPPLTLLEREHGAHVLVLRTARAGLSVRREDEHQHQRHREEQPEKKTEAPAPLHSHSSGHCSMLSGSVQYFCRISSVHSSSWSTAFASLWTA